MMTRLTAMLLVLAAAWTAAAEDKTEAPSNAQNAELHPKVKIETTLGDIVLELDGEKAPISTLNFVQYVEDKYYDGTIFHRVIASFMIQGGGFTAEMDEKKDGLRSPIKNEWQNGLKNIRGTIAMARTPAPDSATSQFFINVVDNDALDQPRGGAAYAVFGKVVEGMETVDKIRDVETSSHPKYANGSQPTVPTEAVVIKSATVVGAFDKAKIEAGIAEAEARQKAEKEKALADQLNAMKEHAAKIAEETGKEAVTTDSGLMYIDLIDGEGDLPPAGAKVEVHYTGWLLDGTKFDSSVDRGQPYPVSLAGGVIQGWLEGLATMNVGGKRKLIIPPDLGYGEQGRPPKIPPNSVLVFDVELMSIME